jgi:hypothetical protein
MAKPGEKSKPRKLPPQLEALTQGNPALRRALQRLIAHEKTGSVDFLAALQPAEWIDLVYEHGAPAGSSPADYAEELAAAVAKPKEKPRRGA